MKRLAVNEDTRTKFQQEITSREGWGGVLIGFFRSGHR